MQHYGVREVEKLLGLPRSTIRALIAAGFVEPERGPRNAWRFSFRDLIVLRTAQALSSANVPPRRITKALKELRRRLPDEMPLSRLGIAAIADQVVVREGGAQWHAESGQYALQFDGDPETGSLSIIERKKPAPPPPEADEWYERGVALEIDDPEIAIRAYERAIAIDPKRLDARINLGRLLHENGATAKAERVYRDALKHCGNDPLLLYNFGVLLDDQKRRPEAMAAYELALKIDPDLADCHYNLALICEEMKRPKDAIRHMAQYRKLVGKGA